MLSVIVFAALVKISLHVNSPWVATIIYGAWGFLSGLLFGVSFVGALLVLGINLGVGFFFFWLLKRTENSGLWWGVVAAGIAVFLVLPIFI